MAAAAFSSARAASPISSRSWGWGVGVGVVAITAVSVGTISTTSPALGVTMGVGAADKAPFTSVGVAGKVAVGWKAMGVVAGASSPLQAARVSINSKAIHAVIRPVVNDRAKKRRRVNPALVPAPAPFTGRCFLGRAFMP